MTTLNTIIEEEKNNLQTYIDTTGHRYDCTAEGEGQYCCLDNGHRNYKNIESFLTTAMQRAYEAGEKKGQEEERESIEAIFKKYVPPHAMGLEDSVWLKRVLNKAFGHENIH